MTRQTVNGIERASGPVQPRARSIQNGHPISGLTGQECTGIQSCPRRPALRRSVLMSRVFALISCLAGGLLVAAGVHAQSVTWQSADEAGQGQTPVMPVHQEPHHRQVFQYGPMRIIDLQIPPGDMSWFHTHEWPVFYLTVADSQTRTQILGEEWGARGRGAGPGAAGR